MNMNSYLEIPSIIFPVFLCEKKLGEVIRIKDKNSFYLGSNLQNCTDVDEVRSCTASLHGFT